MLPPPLYSSLFPALPACLLPSSFLPFTLPYFPIPPLVYGMGVPRRCQQGQARTGNRHDHNEAGHHAFATPALTATCVPTSAREGAGTCLHSVFLFYSLFSFPSQEHIPTRAPLLFPLLPPFLSAPARICVLGEGGGRRERGTHKTTAYMLVKTHTPNGRGQRQSHRKEGRKE